jgi:hypothetical protein
MASATSRCSRSRSLQILLAAKLCSSLDQLGVVVAIELLPEDLEMEPWLAIHWLVVCTAASKVARR